MSLNGILLLNKAQGITSNRALQQTKYLLGAKKAGHTGSLDPLATGMLPLCFGEATKVCQYLLDADKVYETSGLLGIKTTTADSMGDVVAQATAFTISEPQLESVLRQYRGSSKQVPSMYSALKHKGRPLYKYAREGLEVERKARDIAISRLQLDNFDGKQFSLTVHCSKGTYIRNLVEDIGESLGVGAHVTRLHRVYIASFEALPMYTFQDLETMSQEQRLQCLLPMDSALGHLNRLVLAQDEIVSVRQGRVLDKKVPEMLDTCFRLYDEQQCFIGLGESDEQGNIKAKRLLSF